MTDSQDDHPACTTFEYCSLRCQRIGRTVLRLSIVLAVHAALLAGTNGAYAQAGDASATRNVDVGVYVSPPFVEGDDGSFQGMAMELWEAVAGKLGLASHYMTYPTFRDLLDAVRTGKVDIAVTNLTITRQRAETLALTQPWYDAGLRIMVPYEGSTGLRRVLAGLSDSGHLRAYAWLLTVILAATVGLTIFDRRFDPDFPRRWREGFAESLYHVMSVATSGRTVRKNLFGWMGRVWAAVWMVCGVAVIAYVTSSVTSVMTTVSLERGIHSLADLPGKTAGVFTGSVAEGYLAELGIALRSYPAVDDAAQAMEAGQIDAIVGDAPILEYYAHSHPERKVAVVGNLFHPDKYGFALPLGSELAQPVTLQLLGLHEDGTIEKLRLKYFGSTP